MKHRGDLWVFGYGSLIWRPGFPHREAHPAGVRGWARRFWQGSHDHRGTPEAPGRVVTLVEAAQGTCHGRVFRVAARDRAAVLALLDHREKNGYERTRLDVELPEGRSVRALTYVAPPRNPAFLGPAELHEMARHIAASRGPSGPNPDYLFELTAALRRGGIHDEHVEALDAAVRALLPPAPDPAV